MSSFREELLREAARYRQFNSSKKSVPAEAISSAPVMVETEFGDTVIAPDAQTQPVPKSQKELIREQIEATQGAVNQWVQAARDKYNTRNPDGIPVIETGPMAGSGVKNPYTSQQEYQKYLDVRVPQARIDEELSRARHTADTYTEKDQERDATRGREKGVVRQLWDGATNLSESQALDILTSGLPSTFHNRYTNRVLEKAEREEPLSKEEQLLVNARGATQAAEHYVDEQGGATILHSTGATVPSMIQYALETAAFGKDLGVGKAAKATGRLIRSQKGMFGKNLSTFGKEVGKTVVKEEARALILPSTLQKFEERTGAQYFVRDDGTVDKDEASWIERAFKAWQSNFSERFTEQGGALVGMIPTPKFVGKIAPKLFGSRVSGWLKELQPSREYLQRTFMLNNYIAENAEEYANNLIEPILTGEPERIKENFTAKNTWVTFGATALFGGVANAGRVPSIVRHELQGGKLRKQTNGAVAAIEDQTLRQGVFDALKKGQTVEQKATQLASLDWNNVSQSDAAHVVDAFSSNLRHELFKGVDQEQSAQEEYARQYALFNTGYGKIAHQEVGTVQEVLDDEGNSYYLLAGSLDGAAVDNTLFVYNAQTGQNEQLDRSRINYVEPTKTYGESLNEFNRAIGIALAEQTKTADVEEFDSEAAEAGVAPVTYAQGEVVELSDGRSGEFIGYLPDGATARVAILDEQTGEPNTIEVHRNQVVGLAEAVESTATMEQPTQTQSTTASPAEVQAAPTPSVPLQKDGTPDYEAMSAEQFLEHYGNEYSREEAVAELAEARELLEKQLAGIGKSNSANLNTRAKNKAKATAIQRRINDITSAIGEKVVPIAIEKVPSIEARMDNAPKRLSVSEQLDGYDDPVSLRDYILREIAQGKKFRWKDEGSSRGVASALGFVGNERERRSRIGLLKKDGDTPERYAEHLTAEVAPQFGITQYSEVRDEVEDILRSVNSRGKAIAQLEARHDNLRKQQEDYAAYAEHLQERAEKEVFDASVALDEYLSQMTEAEFAQMSALFAEELLPLKQDGSNEQSLQQPAARSTETGAQKRDFTRNEDSRTQWNYGEGRLVGDDQGSNLRSGTIGPVGSGRSGNGVEPTQQSDGTREFAASDQIASALTDAERRGAVEYWVRVFNKKTRANVSVFAYVKELPEELRPYFDPSFENSGVSCNGASYLNATAIRSKAELEQLYVHEVVGHQLVDRLPLDQRKVLFEAVVKSRSLDQMVVAMPAFNEVAKQYSAGYIDGTQVAREYLAYLAEHSVGVTQLGLTGLGEVLVVDTSDGLSNLDFIEVLTALANGVQSIEIRTEGSSNRGIYNSGYSAVWRESADRTVRRAVNAQSGAEAGLVGDARTQGSDARTLGELEAGHSADTKQAQYRDLRRDGSQDAGVGGSLVGTDEVAADPSEVRFSESNSDYTPEMDRIKSDALVRGDFMRAPNGNPTNLTEHQWLQVRTTPFKEWFGDWEHAARIEKLRMAEPISITGEEITPSDDLKQYKRNALEYGKSLRGEYINADTSTKIVLSRESLTEILHHDYKNTEHLQSIAAIPQIIEKSIFIAEEKSSTNDKIDNFEYFVSGLVINGESYTVKSVVTKSKDGTRYYDHKLTQIEKGELISLMSAISSTVSKANNSPLSDIKDKRLLSILQVDASKIVDANGEPLAAAITQWHGDIRFKGDVADQTFAETERQQKHEASKLAKEQSDIARRAEIDAALQKLTEKFGVATVQVDTAADLPAPLRAATKDRRFAGLYHKPSGAVYLIGSELRDADHATATYLHEVVAHKGIDGLLGQERAARFYAAVFDALKPKEQARLLADCKSKLREGEVYNEQQARIVSGDEVVARMAEGDVTPGTMQRIIAAVRRFFREVLGVPLTISDTDIRYILFKSKISLQRTNNLTDAMRAIEADQRMLGQLSVAQMRLQERRTPIEKLRSAEPVLITGNEIEPSDDLKQYRRNALEYGKTIRGAYTNKDTGQDIRVSRESITEVLSHSIADTGHIASVAAIPDVIENATYITTLSNEKQRSGVVSYDYYACGLKIGGVDYTVKMVVANTGLGDKYYDHKLTEIEKGRLLDLIQSSKEEGESTPVSPVIHKSGSGINPPLSEIKDTRLISILQNNLLEDIEQNDIRYSEVKPLRQPIPHRVAGNKGRFGDKGRIGKAVEQIGSAAVQVQEALQDATIKVHLLQNEIKQGGGTITPLTNAYEALNHVDSRADAEMRKYKRHYMDPIVDHIKQWRKDYGLEYDEVTDYLLAKHSLERHASGINALDEKEDGKWTKEHATKQVGVVESVVSEAELTAFWADWRKATHQVLEIAVQSGRMSLDEKREILGKGWQYYVPLRGKDFDFEQVADMRDVFYYDMNRGQGGTSVSKRIADVKAKGRSSKAADPIAALQHMAYNEIYLSAQNNARRTLLRLVEANPQRTDLFAVRQKWYVKSPDGLWAETDQAPDAEKIRQSVSARKALRTEKDPVRRAKLQEQITVSLRERDASEVYTGAPEDAHFVSVMKDGIRYTVKLVDPEVAAAINYKAGGVQRLASKYVGRPTRIMAQLNTSKNPAFILPNFVRDMQQAALYNLVDSEGNIKGFMNHALGSWKILDRNLRGLDRPLTAAELGTLDITNQADRAQLIEKYGKDRVNDTLYDLFVANGGETGYVHIADPKDYQRKLEKEIQTEAGGHWGRKAWKGINTGVDYMAAMSENSVRYATFMSQVDRGKSVFDAVVYAKNITVNFNRKGKYTKGIGALFMFFNAGIQGVDNQLSLIDNRQGKDKKTIRKQRARFVAAKAIQVTLGYYSSYLLGSALSALIGDDGEEYTVSDYERRTNFIFPVGGKYVKIPIAIPDRPFYALGVMVGDMLDGKMTASDVTEEFASMFIDAYNPIQSDFIDPNNGTTHLKRLIPSFLKPMLDLEFNQDYMGLPISKKKHDDYTPDSQLGLKKTAWWAKAIAKELNEWGGGNSATPAGVDANGEKGILNWLDVSPGSIEHLLGSYSGGMGRIVSDVAALIGGDTEVRRRPIVNRFVGEPYEKRPSSDYYKLKEAIEFRDRTNRKTVANGEKSAIYAEEEFEQKAKTDQEWRRYLQQSDKQIKKLREELDNAPDGSAKHDQIEKEIARQQREFIQEYNAQDND